MCWTKQTKEYPVPGAGVTAKDCFSGLAHLHVVCSWHAVVCLMRSRLSSFSVHRPETQEAWPFHLLFGVACLCRRQRHATSTLPLILQVRAAHIPRGISQDRQLSQRSKLFRVDPDIGDATYLCYVVVPFSPALVVTTCKVFKRQPFCRSGYGAQLLVVFNLFRCLVTPSPDALRLYVPQCYSYHHKV